MDAERLRRLLRAISWGDDIAAYGEITSEDDAYCESEGLVIFGEPIIMRAYEIRENQTQPPPGPNDVVRSRKLSVKGQQKLAELEQAWRER